MSDEQSIRQTIKTYFECMHEASAEKTHAAFHPNGKIVGEMGGALQEWSVQQFADIVAAESPSPADRGDAARLEVVYLEIAGSTALARVRDDYLGNTFLDTLSFVKTDGRWQIYNKLFHVEGKAGSD